MAAEFTVPGKAEFADLKGQKRVQQDTYDDLRTIIEVVNEAEEPLAFEHVQLLAEERGFDGSDNTFKKRVKLLFDWKPALLDWIVGQHPKAVSWVDVGARHVDVEDVTCATMNNVKRGCAEKGDLMKDEYAKASMREFQARSLENSLETADLTGGLPDVVDAVMSEIAMIAADELPSRVQSINQATKSIAGDANEEIYNRCLRSIGYSSGDEFSEEGDDADLIVFSEISNGCLNAEVKSEKSRERASRSLMDEKNPWVLCSFFDDEKEVRNGMFDGNDQGTRWIESSVAAYVPPSTLADVKVLDEKVDDGNEAYEHRTNADLWGFDGAEAFDDFLFLRSNEEFAADMQHYREYGTLQDLDPGHEA
ncbi:hypothetical protein [Halobacterium hubeiense]|uniref:hypothetical protein n=1 Tax=Halobacterium hubeiense TaxID=1407499 RepID=UPI000B7EDC8E|nr:hypothetical protein [Halobacterium hubeiense]